MLVARRYTLRRQGLSALLANERDLRVVGEARDPVEALARIEHLRPNVCIVDLYLSGGDFVDGFDLARRSRTPTVILSPDAGEAGARRAVRASVAGYVTEEADAKDLVSAVRAAARGEHYWSAPFTAEILEAWRAEHAEDRPEKLTAREREILRLAAEGCSNAEIAGRLSISPRTVETHRSHLKLKLGLQNQTDLVAYAFRTGVLPKD